MILSDFYQRIYFLDEGESERCNRAGKTPSGPVKVVINPMAIMGFFLENYDLFSA